MGEFFTDLLNQILGEHGLAIWGAGLFWSIMGILIVKVWQYPRGTKFSWTYWKNDNTRDVLLGLLASAIVLRLGDYAIHILKEKFEYDLPESTDFVAFMILISAFIQYKLHKNRDKLNKSN